MARHAPGQHGRSRRRSLRTLRPGADPHVGAARPLAGAQPTQSSALSPRGPGARSRHRASARGPAWRATRSAGHVERAPPPGQPGRSRARRRPVALDLVSSRSAGTPTAPGRQSLPVATLDHAAGRHAGRSVRAHRLVCAALADPCAAQSSQERLPNRATAIGDGGAPRTSASGGPLWCRGGCWHCAKRRWNTPDTAVSARLSQSEWEALWCHVLQRTAPPQTLPSVRRTALDCRIGWLPGPQARRRAGLAHLAVRVTSQQRNGGNMATLSSEDLEEECAQ